MKGYCLFENLKVQDLDKLETYKKLAGPLVQKYEGKYLILGGKPDVVEGSWEPAFLVMIEFPSYEKARAWYDSAEYREIRELRLSAVDSNGVILEGI